MKKPSVIDSPSGRVPEKASRWDRKRIEACGGGKVFLLALWGFPNICEFIEVELGQMESRGPHKATRRPPPGRALLPCEAFVRLLAPPKASKVCFFQKKSPKSFVAFGLHLVLFLLKAKNKQKTATGTGH